MDQWDPWENAEAIHVAVVGDLPSHVDGVFWPTDTDDLVLLNARLDGAGRRETLAHELVHAERGGGTDHPSMPASWQAVVARDEGAVDDEVARRLVPRADLLELIQGRIELGESIAAEDVADRFGVSRQVAHRALGLLHQETGGRL